MSCQVKNIFFFVDIFLQYRIALTWIYPAVKYASYRPNIQPEIKKCDQTLGFQRTDDYYGKKKKLIKHSSSTYVEFLKRVTPSTRNTNQNFAINMNNDCSYRKKRKKYSTKLLGITTANEDFTRYLSEKKLHDIGIVNLKKYNSNKNIRSSFEFNQFVSVYQYYYN